MTFNWENVEYSRLKLPVLRPVVLLVLVVLCGLFTTSRVFAHEVRPAYLQLHQTGAETYDVLWKVPGRGEDLRLSIYVELPKNCTSESQPRGTFGDNAFTEQWGIRCANGLIGNSVRIDGLKATMTDVLVRIERLDGTTQITRLTPGAPAFVVEAAPRVTQVGKTYLLLGIEHILTGWDHLLYILAMLMLVKGWKRVVATMSAFTATHSLTLTAAALGWVDVPQRPVEACIALSILFVASEIVRERNGNSGLTARWPWAISFTFGLLHGFGFAGALAEVGLPQKAIPVALLFFNLGVEVGQLIFVVGVFAVALLAQQASRRFTQPRPTWSWRVPPYAIGAVAAFWFLQRLSVL
ncbi:MAG TPA: HupE/UreJ family protein [Pyrinomonadaceae bacterium]|nr:HupE/UreJ family protein [Pyrinomonadaceae bacterium]